MIAVKTKIVLVDDEAILTRALKLILERTGNFEVWAENNPRRAWDLIQAQKPDVILLDIIMPGLSGTELALHIRSHPLFIKTPIIFYSGCQSGPPGFPFIAKPATRDEIVKVIEDELRSGRE